MSTNGDLPTTPIGKQQVIDMRAGAILKESKTSTYSPRLLLLLITFLKCTLLALYLLREYHEMDYNCLWSLSGGGSEEPDYGIAYSSDEAPRVKRSSLLSTTPKVPILRRLGSADDYMDPRMKRRRGPMHIPQTTMVTFTNTQMVKAMDGSEEEELRMKTIRNRIEPIADDVEDDDPMDEDSLEIDLQDPPKIFISKIVSRAGIEDGIVAGEPAVAAVDAETTTKKPRKGKGKGRKKKKQEALMEPTTTTTTTEPTTKKRKGLGRKKLRNQPTTLITKAPRHLFSGVASSGVTTTMRPHQSNFLAGAIDPKDDKFSNQGHIRGYPLQKATRKPVISTKLSEETRLAWQLDEHNFTTLANAKPATTEMTNAEMSDIVESVVVNEASTPTTTAEPEIVSEFTSEPDDAPEAPPSVLQLPTRRTPSTSTAGPPIYPTMRQWLGDPLVTDTPRIDLAEESDPSGPIGNPSGKDDSGRTVINSGEAEELPTDDDDDEVENGKMTTLQVLSTKTQLDPTVAPPPVFTVPSNKENRVAKPGFGPPADERMTDSQEAHNFRHQLAMFVSSALCYSRSAFDIWCLCQLVTSFPFLLGICAARKSLFVPHTVLDGILLVLGFLYSITAALLAIVLYMFVEGMEKETLLHFVLFALALSVSLIIYTVVVRYSTKFWWRLTNRCYTTKNYSNGYSQQGQMV